MIDTFREVLLSEVTSAKLSDDLRTWMRISGGRSVKSLEDMLRGARQGVSQLLKLRKRRHKVGYRLRIFKHVSSDEMGLFDNEIPNENREVKFGKR